VGSSLVETNNIFQADLRETFTTQIHNYRVLTAWNNGQPGSACVLATPPPTIARRKAPAERRKLPNFETCKATMKPDRARFAISFEFVVLHPASQTQVRRSHQFNNSPWRNLPFGFFCYVQIVASEASELAQTVCVMIVLNRRVEATGAWRSEEIRECCPGINR
jgi:hypothetical protein